MKKAFGILFGINAALILLEIAIGMPVAKWQIIVTGLMGFMFAKHAAREQAREERIGQIYSSYDPKTYKAPTKYHEM